LQRRGLVESDLSIAPREGIDFFTKRAEYLLLFPVEIRIDDAVQIARETQKWDSSSLSSLSPSLSLSLSLCPSLD
jgi:hypothetical protein